MTYTLLLAALFLSALTIGCQENSITDSTTMVPTAAAKTIVEPTSSSGKIALLGIIGAEKGDDKDLEHKIVGQISYKISAEPNTKKQTLRIGLDMEAELIRIDEGSSVKIAGGSMDRVTISDKAGEQLDKRYRIETKNGIIVLRVRLMITEKEASLDRMWIERQGFGDGTLAHD
ncbi:MAG: hypothetical protein ACKVRP_14200 [Bacteroidota bacterium]